MNDKSQAELATLHDETQRLAAGLKSNHGDAAMSVACLLHLNTSLLRQFGQANGTNVEPLLGLQRKMMLNWISDRGISLLEITDALRSLAQAGETLGYLTGLPA